MSKTTDKQYSIKVSSSKEVVCFGEDEFAGHPKIYLQIDPLIKNYVICPYCNTKFVLKHSKNVD